MPSSHIIPGEDVYERKLELQQMRYAESGASSSPPRPPRDKPYLDADFTPIPTPISWPEGFSPGEGRIGHLNKQLLSSLNRLAVLINNRRRANAVYARNKDLNLEWEVLNSVKEAVTKSERNLKKYLPLVKEMIAELDAVGGKHCYHIDADFADDLGAAEKYIVCPSGRFSYLLQADHYFAEEIGPDSDDPPTNLNRLAHFMNRLEFMSAAGKEDLKQSYKNLVIETFENGVHIDDSSRLSLEVNKLVSERNAQLEKEEMQRLDLRKKVMDLLESMTPQERQGAQAGIFKHHLDKVFVEGYKGGDESVHAQYILNQHKKLKSPVSDGGSNGGDGVHGADGGHIGGRGGHGTGRHAHGRGGPSTDGGHGRGTDGGHAHGRGGPTTDGEHGRAARGKRRPW